MWNWIYENRDWIFSGIGVVILTAIFSVAKSRAGFKLTFNFYMLLFIGSILAFGTDYFFNIDGDWRLRIFIFGALILMTFIVDNRISHVKMKCNVRKAARSLSLEDCFYVQKCYHQDEYFTFTFGGAYIEFEAKWKNVLYIPVGKMVTLHKPYKIFVYEYAYKVVKKRLRGESK